MKYQRAEDINVSYEEALNIAPPQLREKIQHSVELIRKAEKIALKYDPEVRTAKHSITSSRCRE